MADKSDKDLTKPHRLQSAVKWAFIMNWGPNAIATLMTFVLAAYLGPRDYGVVAMALLYIAFVQVLLEGGLGAAIVQRQNLEPEHLDAVFWITLAFSLVLTILTWILSPAWSWLNQSPPLLVAVLNVEALTLPLQGLTVVQESLLEKKLDFKSLAVRSNISTLIGGVVGLTLAVKGKGVWALVAEDVTFAVIRLLLLWRLGDWRPRLRFSWFHIKDLFHFSLYVMLGQIGTFVQRRSDALLIGIFFGPAAVGIYRLADRLINVVIELATRPFVMVFLPHFARLQDNVVELRKSVMKCLRTSTMLTMPMLAFLASLAYLICTGLSAHGQNWRQATHVIQILAFVGAARAITLFAGPLMQAINRPGQFMWLSWSLAALNIVSFCVAGWLLYHNPKVEEQAMGIAAVRAVVFCLLYMPACLYIMTRICQIPGAKMARALAPAILSSLVISVVGLIISYGLEKHFPAPTPFKKLFRLGVAGGMTSIVAAVMMYLFEPSIKDMVMERLARRANKQAGFPIYANNGPEAPINGEAKIEMAKAVNAADVAEGRPNPIAESSSA